jgi:hypothetical protein
MGKERRKLRYGRLTFFAPTFLVVFLIAWVVLGSGVGQQGTLVVLAETSGKYESSTQLHVFATVNGKTMTTPFNLTLGSAVYSVTFPPVAGYLTPGPRGITVLPGKPAYAVGLYNPRLYIIAVSGNGFNVTRITVLYQINPVVWINYANTVAVLQIDPVGRVDIRPGQNFTYVFLQPGIYSYSLLLQNFTGEVSVS